MNDLTQKLVVSLVFVPVLVGIFVGWKEMGVAAGALVAALFFANLDKFSSFKGGGVEAQLRTAVNEAYAAIEQLKELGLSLSSPIVDELAVSGKMFQYLPLKHKLERVERIRGTLRKLGASDREIEDACSTIYERVASDHVRKQMYALREANPTKKALFLGIEDGDMDGWDQARIRSFISENSLTTSDESEELLIDLRDFLETRKLRREAIWQS